MLDILLGVFKELLHFLILLRVILIFRFCSLLLNVRLVGIWEIMGIRLLVVTA